MKCLFFLVNEATAHKYHKNTSKLAELAEEFKKNKDTNLNVPKLVIPLSMSLLYIILHVFSLDNLLFMLFLPCWRK